MAAQKWISCSRDEEDGPRFGLFSANEAISRDVEEHVADDPAALIAILGAAR